MLSRSVVPDAVTPMDCRPPGSSDSGIFQARITEWVVLPSLGDVPDPGIEPESPELAGRFFTTEPPGKPKEQGPQLFSHLFLALRQGTQ